MYFLSIYDVRLYHRTARIIFRGSVSYDVIIVYDVSLAITTRIASKLASSLCRNIPGLQLIFHSRPFLLTTTIAENKVRFSIC